jgi:hypothetical protein
MVAHSLHTTNIDLSDNATFARGFPHDHFTWAREHAPVYWHEPTVVTPDGEGFWVMTRHEDAMVVMLDPVTFSSDKGGSRTAGGTGLHDEYQAGKFLNATRGCVASSTRVSQIAPSTNWRRSCAAAPWP